MTPDIGTEFRKALDQIVQMMAKIVSSSVYEAPEPFVLIHDKKYRVIPPTAFDLISSGIVPSELTLIACEEMNAMHSKKGKPLYDLTPRPQSKGRQEQYLTSAKKVLAKCIPELDVEALFTSDEAEDAYMRSVLIQLAIGELEQPSRLDLEEFVATQLYRMAVSYKSPPTSWPMFAKLKNTVTGYDLDGAASIYISTAEAMERGEQIEFLGAMFGASVTR